MCWPGEREKGHLDATGRINIHPNYEYRLLNGQWQEVEIGPERVGLPANLLVRRTTIDQWIAAKLPVPLAEKRRQVQGTNVKLYREVVDRVGCR
jgi:hypothetical protein